MQPTAPDLRITPANSSQQLIVSGSPSTIRQAKELIAALDVVPPSVVLDTEVLEVDSNSSKNLGLQLVSPAIGSTFSEVVPSPDPSGAAARIMAFQPLTRTGISLQAQLNLLVQRGSARVLADPRITTLSGKTATIRAGDTLGILTTVGGGPGTITTSQLQTFQTGVTLDITPLVSSNGEITVALHPVVNSLSGILNGVPQISTRDAQTTVHLKDNETLVIGGLIQENGQRTENRIPVLGDLPLLGGLFRNTQTSNTRNELVIVVTPHVLGTGSTSTIPQAVAPALPRPQLLPTLPPGTVLPGPKGAPPARPQAAPPLLPPPTAAPMLRNDASSSPTANPLPTPTAFARADVYTFGSPPPSTYAGPGDAVSVFYATFAPTTVHEGTPVTVSVITSSNVRQVTIGPHAAAVNLAQIAPGKWQAAYNFGAFGLPVDQTAIQLEVVASRGDGASSTIRIPINYVH